MAVYLNMLPVKAELYFFLLSSWLPYSIWVMLNIEFIRGLLNLENNLVI